MEDLPKTDQISVEPVYDKVKLSQLPESAEGFKHIFELSEDRRLKNDLKNLQLKFNSTNQQEKDSLIKTGDLHVTEDATQLKQEVQTKVLNMKHVLEQTNSSSVKENALRAMRGKNTPASVSVTKAQSLTQRLAQTKPLRNASNTPRSVFSSQRLPHNIDHKKSTQNISLATNLKRSISFQPLASEAKTRREKVVTPVPKKSIRHQNKEVTNVKKLGRDSSVSPLLLRSLSKVKTSSPTLRRKNKSKLRSSKKLTKQRETPDTEPKRSGTIESAEISDALKQAIPQEKIRKRSTKAHINSKTKLESRNSEDKSTHFKLSVRAISTSKVRGLNLQKKARTNSTRTLSEQESTKSSPRPKFTKSESKSSTPTKQLNSVRKTQESHFSRKTTSASKLQDQSMLLTKTKSTIKVGKVKATFPLNQTLSGLRLHESISAKSSSNQRCSSASIFSGNNSKSKFLFRKSDNSKHNMSMNANTNNVNEMAETEQSEGESQISFSFAKVSGDCNTFLKTESNSETNVATTDQLSACNASLKHDERESHCSMYSPSEPIEINISNLMSNHGSATSISINNAITIPSKLANRIDNETKQESKNCSLYHLYFAQLVESSIDEESHIMYNAQAKPNKHKVRFNLHSSEADIASMRHERQRNMLAEQDFNKHQSSMLNNLNTTNNLLSNFHFSNSMTNNLHFSNSQFNSLHVPNSPNNNSHNLSSMLSNSHIPGNPTDGQKFSSLLRIPRKISKGTKKTAQSQKISQDHKTPRKLLDMWTTILKSRKWRALYSSQSFLSHLSDTDDERSAEDQEYLAVHSDTDATPKHRSRSSRTARKNMSITKRRINQRASQTGDTESSEVEEPLTTDILFPPYTWNYEAGSTSATTSEQTKTGTCDFVESEMSEIIDYKHIYKVADTTVLSYPQHLHKKNCMNLLKWNHLIELVTKEIKRECNAKGYEFLQRLSRGTPRIHSLLFLANNKSNSLYTPVEVTATRLPYANFISSVATMAAFHSDQHYLHAWVASLPSHKNLVMILHRFCTPNWIYHVSQHCTWPSLSQLLSESSKKSEPQKCQGLKEPACKSIFRQICAGMSHLHEHGVLHGDLTCFNVLVSSNLQVKLAGYGPLCQRVIGQPQTMKGHAQIHGDVYSVNTPPELIVKKDTWTKSCDVWCMGITLLQMTIGDIPNEVSSALRLNGTSNLISRLHLPGCGYQLSRLIDKILQPNACNRPSVANISNHPWLSDGIDLAAVFTTKENKSRTRRMDGSTFPLPKRFQNRENPAEGAFNAQSVYEELFNSSEELMKQQLEKGKGDGRYTCYNNSFLQPWKQEPSTAHHSHYGNDVEDNCPSEQNYPKLFTTSSTISDSFCALKAPMSLSSTSSRTDPSTSCSFSPRLNLISGTAGHLGNDVFLSKSVTRDSKKPAGGQVTFRSDFSNCQPEGNKGCDLLKMMENMTLLEEYMKANN